MQIQEAKQPDLALCITPVLDEADQHVQVHGEEVRLLVRIGALADVVPLPDLHENDVYVDSQGQDQQGEEQAHFICHVDIKVPRDKSA